MIKQILEKINLFKYNHKKTYYTIIILLWICATLEMTLFTLGCKAYQKRQAKQTVS